MRWKVLLLLFCAVALLERTITVQAADGADDVTEEDETEEVAASGNDNVEQETESVLDHDDEEPGDDSENEETQVNEDAVEVDSQTPGKPEGKKGRYQNYDDFLSNLDTYDDSYNWEGKFT